MTHTASDFAVVSTGDKNHDKADEHRRNGAMAALYERYAIALDNYQHAIWWYERSRLKSAAGHIKHAEGEIARFKDILSKGHP
jgi:hypothetical protein